jgi:Tfp pilus assembly protein PilN
MAAIRKQNQDLEKMGQQKKDIENKIHVVHLLTSPTRRAACVHILDDLSESAPQMLWLMEFSEVKGAVKINGKSVDNQTVAAFARKLSNSRYFKTVEIRETVREKPLENKSFQAAGRKGEPSDTPPIPVTRFLVEAAIDYLPGIEKGETGKEENTAKEAGSQPNKNASEKRQ